MTFKQKQTKLNKLSYDVVKIEKNRTLSSRHVDLTKINKKSLIKLQNIKTTIKVKRKLYKNFKILRLKFRRDH